MLVKLALLLGALYLSSPAQAHKSSDSYLILQAEGPILVGQWDIALRDLDFALGIDTNNNDEITWAEVRTRHGEIAAYVLARLKVDANGKPCLLKAGRQRIDDHTDGAYTVLEFQAVCPQIPQTLTVGYNLFADLDPQHRGLLRLEAGGQTSTAIFSPQAATQHFELKVINRWSQFFDYAVQGMHHIWAGYDHILFLLSLLLPTVLVWSVSHWTPAPSFRLVLFDVIRIVTAFTVAHSITFSLATLGLVTLPSRTVESAIALSVVLAALNNVWPLFQGGLWMVAFLFGLIHGFGFASVLQNLGLPRETLAQALVAFNIGIEIGQLTIVTIFLPLAFIARRSVFYRIVLLKGGSLMIALVAGVWLVERFFNLKLIGF